MADSVVWTLTFGAETVVVTATADSSGNLTFQYELTSGTADLIGFYIDVDNDGGAITGLGQGNNMNGSATNGGESLNGFDHAEIIGTTGGNDPDNTSGSITGYTLGQFGYSTLSELAATQIGIRAQSVGEDRSGSLKLAGTGEFCPDTPPQEPSFTIEKILVDINNDTSDTLVNAAGDELTYRVTLFNDGTQALTGVTLSDSLPVTVGSPVETGGSGTNGDGILDVGETWTYEYDYTVSQGDIDDNGGGDGDIDNTATADTAETNPAQDASVAVKIAESELTIEKQILVGCEWVDAEGDDLIELLATEGYVEYRIVLSNTGTTDLTGVTVWDPALGIPEWYAIEIGLIEAGGEVILGADQLCALQTCWHEGEVFNTAYADSDQTEVVSDEANYYGAIACVDIDKVTIDEHGNRGDNLVVAAGSAITWQYTVTNLGNVDIDTLFVEDDAGTLWDERDDFEVTNLVSGDENKDGKLSVGETWVFEETGFAIDGTECGQDGRYENYAMVEAYYTDDAGLTRDLREFDPSSYSLPGYDGGHDGGDDGNHGDHGGGDHGGGDGHDDGCDHDHDHGSNGDDQCDTDPDDQNGTDGPPHGGHPDWHHGGKGGDHMDGCANADWFKGHHGHDKMFGLGGQDWLFGGRGRDEVHGGKGMDHVHGGSGKDKLFGGKGWDHLFGGKGDDKIWGGKGCDVFVFADNGGCDKVLDFDAKGPAHDTIDLSAVTAITCWEDLQENHLEEVGKGVWIRCDDVEIFLKNVDLCDLDRGDFVF